jgi:hypothetical protein
MNMFIHDELSVPHIIVHEPSHLCFSPVILIFSSYVNIEMDNIKELIFTNV